jgi:alpha-galactosidase
MSDSITEGGVAEVYVEHSLECPYTEGNTKEPNDYEAEMELDNEDEEGSDDEVELVGSRNIVTVDSSPRMKVVTVEKAKTVYSSPYEKDIENVRRFYGSLISGSGSSRGRQHVARNYH